MLSAELRQSLDTLWDRLWAGGLTNPVSVIDQLSCLLFLHRLDEQDLAATRAGAGPSIFAHDPDLAWHAWRLLRGDELYRRVRDDVFAWVRTFAVTGTAHAEVFREASLSIPTPELLERAVDVIDRVGASSATHDAAGDVFEYILSRLSVAGHLGQFRTPSHLVRLARDLVTISDDDLVLDPAVGTAGFLIAAHEVAPRAELVGWEVDPQMLRISTMNLAARGIANFTIEYHNTLAGEPAPTRPDVILANPPFAGTVDETALRGFRVASRRSEVLFLDRMESMLADGGRAAVIVPDGITSSRAAAQTALRKRLATANRLEAVISLPAGVFRPYTGVSCSILVWARTEPRADVWMFQMRDDGFTLDDRRSPTDTSDIPALLAAWPERRETPLSRLVGIDEVETNGWRLNPNWYLGRDAAGPVIDETRVSHALERATSALGVLEGRIDVLRALAGGVR